MKVKHPSISEVRTSRPLELLHVDLMGPAKVQSLGEMKYILILVKDKSEASDKMIHLYKKLQVEKNTLIVWIRSDHGRKFENSKLKSFCNDQGTK